MKRLPVLILAMLIGVGVIGCDSEVTETITTTTTTPTTTESTEESVTESSEVITNPNNLPVYEPVDAMNIVSSIDVELDDEAMSKLLAVETYPFRTSYGMGFDSPFTSDYLTSYINENYGTNYELVTIDDVNYYVTNHYYIPAEKFDGDVVNRHIWFSYYSEQFDCEFDCFMVNRAIMLSLGLVPAIDEIPYSYIKENCSLSEAVNVEYLDEIINAWLWESDRELTTEEDQFVNIIKYNIWFHDLYSWTYNIPMCRRSTGEISVNLTPNTMRYQGIIDGCASLGINLNTQMQYYEPTGEEVRVIIPDTPEFFEEIYGRTYESVLEEYGLPVM